MWNNIKRGSIWRWSHRLEILKAVNWLTFTILCTLDRCCWPFFFITTVPCFILMKEHSKIKYMFQAVCVFLGNYGGKLVSSVRDVLKNSSKDIMALLMILYTLSGLKPMKKPCSFSAHRWQRWSCLLGPSRPSATKRHTERKRKTPGNISQDWCSKWSRIPKL